MMLGLGHDVVDVAAFARQLSEPGTRMRGLFSTRELRQAAARSAAKHDDESAHLAGKWAGKESVLKAWCGALGPGAPMPYTLDDFPWAGVEILGDSRGVPHVVLRPDVERALIGSLGESGSARLAGPGASGGLPVWHISISHDGGIASAVAVLEVRG